MDDLRFEKNKTDQKGYLLLESLLTLFVLLGAILLLNPLLRTWFTQKNYEQQRVEENKILYEESFNWQPHKNNSLITKGFGRYEYIEIYEIKLE